MFPDTLAGYPILLSGCNYDFQSKRFACANRCFEAINNYDWVRVSGVIRPESRIKWEWGKGDQELRLGEITISNIERVEAAQK